MIYWPLIAETAFYAVPIRCVNNSEITIQLNSEQYFHILLIDLQKGKKSFYIYQLENGKGMQLVIKVMDAQVDPEKTKAGIQKNFVLKWKVFLILEIVKVGTQVCGDTNIPRNYDVEIYHPIHSKISTEVPRYRINVQDAFKV